MNRIILVFIASVFILPAYGTENIISDANIDVTIKYPDVVTQGNEFVLSSLVKTKADQMSNITVSISSPEIEILQNQFNIQSLPKDSTLGNNFDMKIKLESPNGKFLANVSVDYFIKGFFDEKPVKNTLTKAIEFNVQSRPILLLDFDAPDSVFAGESFTVRGTVLNQGYDAKNIKIIVDSNQITLGGKKTYSLTNLDAGKTENFEFVLQTPKDLSIPAHIILNISTSYFDESGTEHKSEDSLEVFARQRGMLEVGGSEGVWIGNFFIAPVVGVGTIVSSVIGFFIFLWHLKNKKKQKRTRK